MLHPAFPSISALPIVTGHVHSIETCGAVDGPGLRYVVFTQGCPLRCLYCHNPDCRDWVEGQVLSVDDLINDIRNYLPYLHAPGGVTISGGEPLMQPYFVRELCRRCQEELHLHTALDTSGYAQIQTVRDVVRFVDLVLLDIKSWDPKTYATVTQVSIRPTLDVAKYLSDIHKPTWIRFVLVPELTDDPDNVNGLADFVATLQNVEKVEVLPFHQMGKYKWEQMGLAYPLKDTPIPTPDQIQQVVEIFRRRGLQVG
ncbi:pyruvate formate-lyase 1-activating enzyme [Leptolyngbya sp. 'hensonii']|uniref:pyruvate formate-lyase-activating protein n=1 Tax=Leptolyngbya sp. 'hensonii' TaxID=1922337 RepID=UPI00094F5146|nr:pyruvate formate-lyase-activating protein [Leptolyngbya sp. 'hensonii']OLP17627.1 pyruvate formate-lyase 1-activating enzyme [Leptolyngbya sp. 'hensonii']